MSISCGHTFKDGIPVKVTNKDEGTSYEDPLELFTYLNKLGGVNGIGLLDIIENRFVGYPQIGGRSTEVLCAVAYSPYIFY